MYIMRQVVRKPLLSVVAVLLVLGLMLMLVLAVVAGLRPVAGPGDASDNEGTKLAAPPQNSPRPSDTQADRQRTARLLAEVNAPGRDLIALTRRLKLGGRGDIPTVVNSTRPDYPVGTRHTFYVANVTSRGYFTITATIRLVTPHAYWYVKDGYRVDMDLLRASAEQFEDHIYPTNRRVFGSEASPGIDNDPRITILIAPTPGVGGYFSSADAYPRIVNPYSNQRDMIYLTSGPTEPPGDPQNYFEGTLAHEFQHMIQWNVHRNREVWLDEGCSEVAMYLNGYDVGGVDLAFTASPGTQLNAWAEPTSGETMAHYGAAYLFLRYLMHHYGGEAFISTLLRQKGLGEDAIDSALKQAMPGAQPQPGFDSAFKDWVIANTLNDPTLAGGRYSYPEGGRMSGGRTIRSYPATRGGTISQYAADYIRISGDLGEGRLTFRGDPMARVIGADPPDGSHFWYSNRRDTGDATLTREFDLTGVHTATLRFRTWYDIERLFDYAYVEVSTDGGQSWAILKGRYATTDNPNGTAFGPGWTGKSGADPASSSSSAPARWVEESVDLSTYAGRKVLVRFEYITDEGYNRPGIAIDDIRIPEIGFSDDAESDNGWQAGGFVRIGNRMPQKWFVALIERGQPNRVREMTVDANGAGTLDLNKMGAGTPIHEAVLVIAPMAPKTTEPVSYTFTIRQR